MFGLLSLTALALASVASAATSTGGLKILAPGGDSLWWLFQQPNNIVWTCAESQSTFPTFTIWINNANVTLLTAMTAIIPVEYNYNCDQGIDPNLLNVPLGKGYTILMTNINNSTDIYAESEEFEIKPLAVGYPPASATPVEQGSATVSKGSSTNIGGATNTGSGAAPTKSGAATRVSPAGALAVGALVGLMAVV